MRTYLLASATLLLVCAGAVQAQTAADPHAGHRMPPSTLTGSWAHTAAGSPAPHVENRWEAVPAGDSPLFMPADGLSHEQRCGAINASRRMIVDEATKAACAGVPASPLAAHGSTPGTMAQAGAGVAAPATVNAVDAAGRKVNVTHGPIPQIGWPGMTMDLAVSDRVDLKGVRPGDRIEMTLKQGADGIYLIDSLGK